jgi:hypothetical protein
LSKIAKNCPLTGLDDLPAQTCKKHKGFGKKSAWSVLCQKLPKIALYRAWTTSQLKHAYNKNDLEKYFLPGLLYDTLLYLCPIPTKLSIIAQNCFLTGLDNLPAQTCKKHN